jgi:hypothetical protein
MIYSFHSDAHTESHTAQVALLDEYNDIMTAHNRWWTAKFLCNCTGIPDFLKVASVYGLRAYVAAKLTQHDKSQIRESASALLHYLLLNEDCYAAKNISPLPKIEMVSLLLDVGADPNRQYDSQSTFENTLGFFINVKIVDEKHTDVFRLNDHASNELDYEPRDTELIHMQIMEMLLLSGANPRASVLKSRGGVRLSATDVVENILIPKYPLKAASLLRVIQERMSPLVTEGNRKNPPEMRSMKAL